VLLALSANSPFWRADATGMLSTRTPIFRAFPRVGIPPRYDGYDDWSKRIKFMVDSKVIGDYTYLWYDVRPHPNFGTVEVRVMDSQTRVEHTLGLAAMVQAMVKELAEHFDEGKRLSRYPYEMLDENKWLAARHGLDGELVDLPKQARVRTSELAHTPWSWAPKASSTASRTCSTTATGRRARRWSTRPITTSARWSPRFSRPRSPIPWMRPANSEKGSPG
jgi:carboxylate-amine ligase